ncbi:jg21276 [Pararge aegeria aegeria]|uniref:Jg21276 protein n=1 Tax=Pararge aegeria aegeria TaxID=348720 RepID=A0A8S4SF79_9NEOP|nr:jg21276 [Pararge aegeria aegeria]
MMMTLNLGSSASQPEALGDLGGLLKRGAVPAVLRTTDGSGQLSTERIPGGIRRRRRRFLKNNQAGGHCEKLTVIPSLSFLLHIQRANEHTGRL